jgi:uncharacterized protein (TIGR02284 family)
MKTTEEKKATISACTDLVKINNDRIQGYNKAVEQAKNNPELQILFKEKVRESERFVSELNELNQRLGGETTNNPTVSGEVYRGWMSIKDTFKPSDKTSILESCEFGEDAALKAYDMALKVKDLDPDVKSRVEEQRRVIKESHDQIKAKRDASKNNNK